MTEYHNALDTPTALAGWVVEGPAQVEQGESGIVLSSAAVGSGPVETEADAHFTLWCREPFGDSIRIDWQFRPISEPGLAMLFFAASAHSPGGLFSPQQKPRDGHYAQYHSGDLDAMHVSYFRHKWPSERAFRTCNLRKSAGFHLVAQGADPLPPAEDADGFYHLAIEKCGPDVAFFINDLPIFSWHDDGAISPVLGGGHVGLRQMAPLVAEYRNFSVTPLIGESRG